MTASKIILLIDDDTDDKDMFEMLLKDIDPSLMLHWELDAGGAINYLKATETEPFLIFCDINLPKMNGLEFKQYLDSDPELRQKSVPFIFYSTAAKKDTVKLAYDVLTVQGFFLKQDNYHASKSNMSCILSYWSKCVHPKNCDLMRVL